MHNQESKKQQRITLKSQIDDIEGEVSEIKKRLQSQHKEVNGVQKQITALETKLEPKTCRPTQFTQIVQGVYYTKSVPHTF